MKKNVEFQQAETTKAQLKFKHALEDDQKLKADFDAKRAAWDTERASLLKRAEDAEKQLKPVAEELAGLKHHISQMTATIFGK